MEFFGLFRKKLSRGQRSAKTHNIYWEDKIQSYFVHYR